ncbi:hypothetical protein M758_8G061600 [Ceratodon purpureus]|nr:hypothetical protein M758_8G061600 [Ceratodon purpureus]
MKPLRVLVTGASSGLGKALAVQLAREGHSLFLTGRDQKRLGEASDNCKGAKDVFKGLGDVAAEADVARLYSEAVEKLGGIDVAVLNAGVGRHGNIEDISVEDFDLQFNTNVRGVFLWLKHILPHMKGMIEALRGELRGTGVKAARILPAAIATEWWAGPAGKGNPLPKNALTPDDVAAAILTIVNQSPTSDIDRIIISNASPAK